jgi:hypothetical protein
MQNAYGSIPAVVMAFPTLIAKSWLFALTHFCCDMPMYTIFQILHKLLRSPTAFSSHLRLVLSKPGTSSSIIHLVSLNGWLCAHRGYMWTADHLLPAKSALLVRRADSLHARTVIMDTYLYFADPDSHFCCARPCPLPLIRTAFLARILYSLTSYGKYFHLHSGALLINCAAAKHEIHRISRDTWSWLCFYIRRISALPQVSPPARSAM